MPDCIFDVDITESGRSVGPALVWQPISVVGESTRGNLAGSGYMVAVNEAIQQSFYQVLVYPVVFNNINSDSYMESDSTQPLTRL